MALSLQTIGSTANRYEFQGINRSEIIEWCLHWFYEYTNDAYIDFINTLPDRIWTDVCRLYVTVSLQIIGSTANRYEFQGINRLEIIEWCLHWFYEYTARYDLNWCMSTWYDSVPPNDWIHNEQVWVSGYKPNWNNRTRPMFMNTLPDMSGINETSILCGIAPQNDWIHNEQVWVSRKKHPEINKWRLFYEYTTRYGLHCRLCGIAPHNDWTHRKQVWVSGYKPLWNNRMTAAFVGDFVI